MRLRCLVTGQKRDSERMSCPALETNSDLPSVYHPGQVPQASAGGGHRAVAPPVRRAKTGMLLVTAGQTGEAVYSVMSGTSQTIRRIWLLAAPGCEVSKKS